MKNLKLCLFGLLCGAATAMAAPCTVGSLQSYINLGSGGCGVGSLLVTNFVTAPGINGATVINPSTINVTPGGGPSNFTFLFTVNQSASAPGALLDSLFRFTVGGVSLNLASIALGSSSASGDGAVTGILDVCPSAAFPGNSPSGCFGSQSALVSISGTDSRSFSPPASFFDVFVNLTADAGSSGSATLGTATVGFGAVPSAAIPEPSAAWLLGGGIALLGFLRHRAGRRDS